MYDISTFNKGMVFMAKRNAKLAFIGGGNMGGAIIRGLVSSGAVSASDITVCCKSSQRYPSFRAIGVSTADSIASAVADADYVFLCVKPVNFPEVVAECRKASELPSNAIFVSIAASVTSKLICRYAGAEVPVIRTMPGMPLQIGEGTVAVCKNDLVDNKSFAYVCRLLSSVATVSVMEEEFLNPVIAVNGSSPAYVFLLIQSMLEGAKELGISEKQALPLITKTIIGSAKMIEQSSLSPEEEIRRVCSPGGTTLEAMKVFEDADFVGIVKKAMFACLKRANEITESLES